MRRTLFLLTLLVGIALAGIGFGLAAPIGSNTSPVFSSPRLLFAPGLFVIGVVLVFTSAVVYEVVKDKRP